MSKMNVVCRAFRETMEYGVHQTVKILFLLGLAGPGNVQDAFKLERVHVGGLPDTDEKIYLYVKAETLLMFTRSLEDWRAPRHHSLMRSIGMRFFFEAMKIKKTHFGVTMSRYMDELVERHHEELQEYGERHLFYYDVSEIMNR